MIGRTVGHYRVVGKLGIGGMGVVYEATDLQLSRPVALKFLPDELTGGPDAGRRFRREAQTIALLNHPNICTVYTIGEYKRREFIAMERLDGVNLKVYMALKALAIPELINIALQTTEALRAAHAKGIVHRDIKPSNIFVSEAGHVKVLDFGLARRFRMQENDEVPPDGSTILGRPLGTPNYMAPERILQMPVDPRSDLFSLGVVIYEMATGKLPFAGESTSDTVTNILENDPIPLLKASPQSPAALGRLVGKLLSRRMDDRFRSAEELGDALNQIKHAKRRTFRQSS